MSSSGTPRPRRQRPAGARIPPQVPGQAGGRRDTNRKHKQQALLAASRRLFLRHGIESVTIDQIVGRAGIAKGSFYHYYDDKAALVTALFAPIATRLEDIYAGCQAQLAQASGREGLYLAYFTLGSGLAGLVAEHPEAVLLYLQECRGPAVGARRPLTRLAARVLALTVSVTELAMQHGLMRPADPLLTALAVIGASERVVFAHLTAKDPQPTADGAVVLVRLFMSGVVADGADTSAS